MAIRFSTADCKPCALKPRCTRADRRLLTPRRQEEHAALEAARAREKEDAFAAEYRRRAGIEGTLSAGVRAMHLRRSRYVGLAKTHLQHVLTAAATNLARLGAWLADEPLARTRRSTSSASWRSPPELDDFASSIRTGATSAQAPEHHERDDVGRILRPVQLGAGALVELPPARAAAEPTVAFGGVIGALCHCRRPALDTPHSRLPCP